MEGERDGVREMELESSGIRQGEVVGHDDGVHDGTAFISKFTIK